MIVMASAMGLIGLAMVLSSLFGVTYRIGPFHPPAFNTVIKRIGGFFIGVILTAGGIFLLFPSEGAVSGTAAQSRYDIPVGTDEERQPTANGSLKTPSSERAIENERAESSRRVPSVMPAAEGRQEGQITNSSVTTASDGSIVVGGNVSNSYLSAGNSSAGPR